MRIPRFAALVTIAVLVAASALVSFAESYRGLFLWASRHGLSGGWGYIWPLQVDVFIAVGEVALFVALVDRWAPRQRAGAWAVTLAGLVVSVAGNVGHAPAHDLATRVTYAVPPLAAAAALAVGLGVLKRGRDGEGNRRPGHRPGHHARSLPSGNFEAAKVSMAETAAAGNPWTRNQLQTRFRLTRGEADEIWQPYKLPAGAADVPQKYGMENASGNTETSPRAVAPAGALNGDGPHD